MRAFGRKPITYIFDMVERGDYMGPLTRRFGTSFSLKNPENSPESFAGLQP